MSFPNVSVAEAISTGHMLNSGYGIPWISGSFDNL